MNNLEKNIIEAFGKNCIESFKEKYKLMYISHTSELDSAVWAFEIICIKQNATRDYIKSYCMIKQSNQPHIFAK